MGVPPRPPPPGGGLRYFFHLIFHPQFKCIFHIHLFILRVIGFIAQLVLPCTGMESRMVQNSRNNIGFTFNKCLVKVKRYFDQAQQNWLHVQQISCQGQEIFRSSSTKLASRSTNVLSRSRDISTKLNN